MSDWSVVLNNIDKLYNYDALMGKYRISGVQTNGIDGFTFSRAKEHEINLSSSITDYPVEDGNVAQNVITLNPERVKLTGIVAEVVYGKGLVENIINTLSGSLVPLSTLSPTIGAMTTKIFNQLNNTLGEAKMVSDQLINIVKSSAGVLETANEISNALNLGNLFDMDAGLTMSVQEKAYYYLEACWKSRKLLTIETPWRYFEDMVIEELRFVQTETSTSYSDVEVTLKRVIAPQTRQTERTTLKQGRAQTGLAETTQEAATTGKTVIEPISEIKVIEKVEESIGDEYVDAYNDDLPILIRKGLE